MRVLLHGALLAWTLIAPLGLSAFAGVARAEVVFRRGNDAEPESLDPHRIGSHWESAILGDLFLGLTTEDPLARPIPGAAESWTISPDGLVWTFHLRPGMQWSDGVPLTANDFLYGFRRLLDPKTAARYAFIQYVIKNAEKANAGKVPLDQIGVRAIDDLTLEITLEAPTPFLAGLLTHATAYPIPRHLVEKVGDGWVKPGVMVSNGAYVLKEWTPHDRIVAVKNPRFYDAAHVAIDTVQFIPIESDVQAFARYRAGQLDAYLGKGAFPINDLELARREFPDHVHMEPILSSEYLVGNMRKPPFNDKRTRRAMALCIDQKLLTEKVYKDGTLPAYTFVPPGIADYHGGAREDFADWPMDKRRAEARRLLAEAGYGPDHPLEFEYKTMSTTKGRRSVVTEAAMLKECGIIAHIYLNEPKIYYSALQQFDFTWAWAGWVADYNDPYTFLYLLDSRAGAYNYQGYHNPAYDRLMDEAQQIQDIDRRAEVLAKAEQMALDDAALVPLTYGTYRLLVQPYVKGFAENPAAVHRTRWMRLERP